MVIYGGIVEMWRDELSAMLWIFASTSCRRSCVLESFRLLSNRSPVTGRSLLARLVAIWFASKSRFKGRFPGLLGGVAVGLLPRVDQVLVDA